MGKRRVTEFNRVDGLGMDIGGVGLTGEFGRKSHCRVFSKDKMKILNGFVFSRVSE